jgi:hypothetical protein
MGSVADRSARSVSVGPPHRTDSTELANRTRLTWEPLNKLIVGEFDNRVLELQKRGVRAQLSQSDFPLILLGKTPAILQRH